MSVITSTKVFRLSIKLYNRPEELKAPRRKYNRRRLIPDDFAVATAKSSSSNREASCKHSSFVTTGLPKMVF